MARIDKVAWAKTVIDGQKYWQVLIVGKKVIPRKVEQVKSRYGTDHVIADWEQELLLSENPEIILIATGWRGVLEVSSKFKVQSEKLGIEVREVLTPKVVEEYNRLVAEGRRVNALIHTTC